VRLAHYVNDTGRERISAEFGAYTAVGQQTWDYRTKLNGVVFSKGFATTDDTGDLRVQVNRTAEPGQAVVTSLSFDATNRVTGERCQMTVAVPPVDQPLLVDLDPWYAQGSCTQGTPWTLRVQRHVRTNGHEKFSITLRVVDGEPDQWWDTRGSIDGALNSSGRAHTYEDGIARAGATLIGQAGTPLQIEDAEVWAKHLTTGEVCKVSINVLRLP
jgi:hypothetical protein